jgi:hypothetical protein
MLKRFAKAMCAADRALSALHATAQPYLALDQTVGHQGRVTSKVEREEITICHLAATCQAVSNQEFEHAARCRVAAERQNHF